MTSKVTPLSREQRLEAVHEILSNKVESLVSGEDWRSALTFASRFRSRSFQNSMLIWAQHEIAFSAGKVPEPMPTLVAGYKQWAALGRQVDKGQSGYMIFAPVTVRMVVENGVRRRLERGEKPAPDAQMVRGIVGVKPAYVFDVSQTSGDPIPELPRPELLQGQAPVGLREGLMAQIREQGFTTHMVPNAAVIGGANGRTDYVANTVSIRQDMDDAAQVKTLTHELAHVLCHDPREPDTFNHRGKTEVEAESIALLVLEAHGMQSDDYSIPYVASWATTENDKSPSEVVASTAGRCVTAANKILAGLESPQGPDGDPPGIAAVRESVRKHPQQTFNADQQVVQPDRIAGIAL